MPPKILVIGAGLAGLACAQRLHRAGADVTVLDKGAPGGRASTLEEAGFSVNLGPHAFYKGGAGMRVVRALGITPEGAIAPGGDGEREGRRSPLPDALGTWWRSELTPGSSRYTLAPALGRLLLLPPAGTVAEALADLAPPLRELCEALVRVSTYAGDPTRIDAKVAFAQVGLAMRGVLYLHEGWRRLVEPLTSGLRIERRAVSAARGGRVETAEGPMEADHVVVATPPATFRALTGQEPGETVEAAVATLCLGLSALPDPTVPFVLGVDRPLYLSVHSTWARVAPAGGALVHVARYLREGEHGSAEELETWLERHQPGWRDRVVYRRFLPRMRVAGHPVPGGGRPGIAVEPGLWRCGDWVGDEGLLADAALASGDAVARAILERTPQSLRSENRTQA